MPSVELMAYWREKGRKYIEDKLPYVRYYVTSAESTISKLPLLILAEGFSFPLEVMIRIVGVVVVVVVRVELEE